MAVAPNLIQFSVARAVGERRPHTSRHLTVIQQKTLGRPDDADAILDAAGELLVTRGLGALTLEAVARRANVDTSLVCRWWPSERALALDALRHEWLALADWELHGAEGVWR
jgi:AcrR family transcriptional regulator